jgi:chromosome segregation ATPase
VEKPQSGTDDELQAMRKYCSDLQNEKLSSTQESDALRTETDELKANFDELRSKYSAFKENLNTILEEHVLLGDKAKLVGLDGGMEMMFDELSSILKTIPIVTRERNTLRSEHEELKVDFDELKTKYNALKDNLNAITEECDALQKDRDNLVGPEGRVKMMLEELSGIQEAQLILTQERDALRSEHEEWKVNYEKLARECIALKDNLNVITEERDALQKDRDNLVGPEGRVKMMLEELSGIQEAQLILTQERDALRSEHEELKVNYEKLARECIALKDNLNVIREKCDAFQKDKDALLGLVKMTLDEESRIQNSHFLLIQERDAFRSEHEELKVNYEKVARECNALKDNLNVIREKCDALHRDKDMLLAVEATVKIMYEESRIQNPPVLLTDVRDTLRSEYKEVKVDFDKLKQECTVLKEDLNAVQKEKKKLVDLEDGMKTLLDELSSIQNAHLIVTQERDALRSEHDELKVEFDEYKRECSALKKDLKAIREECDVLQREKEKSVGLEGSLKTMLDELSSIKNALVVGTQGAFRLEHDELKVERDKYKRACDTLIKDLNAIREKRDALQRAIDTLVGMDTVRKFMLDEKLSIDRTHLIVNQERATLRSGQEELRVKFDELERVYIALKKM